MELVFKNMLNRTITAAGTLFGLSKSIDYKTLNRYIIGMNESLSLEHVLLEASRCLKEILNYQLFAFAVQDGDRLDVWIDPRMYQQPISRVIERDFGSVLSREVHFLTDEDCGGTEEMAFHESRLISHVIMETDAIARLYVLPQRYMMPYHDEILATIVKTLSVALGNCLNVKRLESDVAVDPLTGCYNRREFDRLIEHHIAGALRHRKDMSLIMFDIDHFKQVNDEFGHPAGDAVLIQFATAVRSLVRKEDYLIRYGGEEFIVLLPDTQLERAIELAARLRKTLEALELELPDGRVLRKTASFGVASFRKDWDAGRLINEADRMLYRAKSLGRNMVMPEKPVRNVTGLTDMLEYSLDELTSCAIS